MQLESKNFSLNFSSVLQKPCCCILTTRKIQPLLISRKEGRGTFLFFYLVTEKGAFKEQACKTMSDEGEVFKVREGSKYL
jgi:hypothetical protein